MPRPGAPGRGRRGGRARGGPVGQPGGARRGVGDGARSPRRGRRPRSRAAPRPSEARGRVVRGEDVEQARRGERRGGTLPECEPPRRRFGAPIITAMPAAWLAAAAVAEVGNSAMRAPWRAEAATCASVVSSWLASTAPSRRASATAAASWSAPTRAPSAAMPATCAAELLLGHAVAALGVGAQRRELGELALAGGVVHQADDADAVALGELGQLLGQGLGADLGAQVQPVADAQPPGAVQPHDLGGERPGVLARSPCGRPRPASRRAARRRPW